MRIIFLGSPKEVISPLEKLVGLCKEASFELVAVVSQPPRPFGRKKILKDPPIAEFAKANGLPLFQPEKCRDEDFLNSLRDLQPDLMITAAYGQILTQDFLDIPTIGTINIHPSLLPEYRGAIPVPAALLDGKKETGVSILYTVKALDAGEIISQYKYEISPDETSDVLLQKLFDQSGNQLIDVIKSFASGSVHSYPQNEDKVTHCKKIDKNDGLICWNSSVQEIYNKFRAYYPWPGSYTFSQGKRVVIESLKPIKCDTDFELSPGEFKYFKSQKLLTAKAKDGYFQLIQLKPAGSKTQDGASFWNGQKLSEKGRFTDEA